MYNQTDISISQFRVAKIAIQNCHSKLPSQVLEQAVCNLGLGVLANIASRGKLVLNLLHSTPVINLPTTLVVLSALLVASSRPNTTPSPCTGP
jgi:hypothetical protein